MNTFVLHTRIKKLAYKTFEKRKNIENIGIVNGRMGLCINLYELGRYLQNGSVTALADDLMDELYISIENAKTLPWQFANGLTGLGWGIEYLVQKGFIEADTNEVLRDIDDRAIVQRKYGTNMSINLHDGFLGLGYYFLKRLQNPASTDDNLYTLLIKQHTIGVIEHLDAFRYHVNGFAKRVLELGHYMILPIVGYYLQCVYKMDIYSTRVDPLIRWFLEDIQSVVPSNESFKLSLILSGHFIGGLKAASDEVKFMDRLSTVGRERLLLEINQSAGISLWDVVKMDHLLVKNYKEAYLREDFIFWCRRAIEGLTMDLDARDNALDLAKKIGLLDGFYGFHKLLAALSLYSKLEVQTVT